MNPIRNNRGVALPLVLIVFTMAVMLGFASLTMIDSQTKFSVIEDSSKKALEYAEAGYNAYLWHLNDDSIFYNTAASDDMTNKWIDFKDGEYRLEVTKPSAGDEFVTIRSSGRTKSNTEITRTIEAKIKKRNFMSYLCIDNGEATWEVGDQCHGPYHTNGKLITKESTAYSIDLNDGVTVSSVRYPVFFNSVSWTEDIDDGIDGTSDRDGAYRGGDPTEQGSLDIAKSNEQLKYWAIKDGMYFTGRTCIYLDGTKVYIRNGANATNPPVEVSDIDNGVIYVDKAPGGGTGKFDMESGNIFISGQLEGRLTIAAANDIYITYKNPTDWSKPTARLTDFDPSKLPQTGGVKYKTTRFNKDHSGDLSYFDSDKGIWTRDAEGDDMLGLVANNDIMVLHYNWPRDPSTGGTYWQDSIWLLFWEIPVHFDVAPKNVEIHGALFALNGGFGFEEPTSGIYEFIELLRDLNAITFWGSIVENKRYDVGESITVYSSSSQYNSLAWGYQRRYAHDPRFISDYPPHIPEPENSGWVVHDWKEIN